MRRSAQIVLLLGLLAAAAALAVAAHSALASHPQHPPAWDRALAYARAAGRQKALIPALTMRARALTELSELGREGPAADRSHALTLAGLLELVNADQDRENSRAHEEQAAAFFQRAVRLDPPNDDAAYDLELLLARAKASGKPVGRTKPERRRPGVGKPDVRAPGSGY
jgi:hypothetical protein